MSLPRTVSGLPPSRPTAGGGLSVSQVLTLFTTPVVYLYMDKLSHWIGGQRRSRGVPAAAE